MRAVTAMSYGHADKIAAILARAQAAGSEKPAPPIDPALYRREDVRRVLAERDIGALFRVLRDDAGLTQRMIAELTGMQQSEVSEILKGRRVLAYDVLVRTAERLGIPREFMGLSYGENSAYRGEVTVIDPPEGVTDEMLRRHFIAGLASTAFGQPLLAGLLDPPPGTAVQPMPLPSRVTSGHVAELRAGTEQLRSLARRYGG
jgi:transcriptional regulator with XRE-family HTH domain